MPAGIGGGGGSQYIPNPHYGRVPGQPPLILNPDVEPEWKKTAPKIGTPGRFGAALGGAAIQPFTGIGGGGLPTTPVGGFKPLTVEAKPSPELQQATKQWETEMESLRAARAKHDEDLRFLIDQYKTRLGEGPTTRAIERSASAIRDQLAGLLSGAETAGAATGRGPGFGAAGLAESAQRAQAGAAADISLGRERDIDRLILGGAGIMGAPGQRELAYYGLTPSYLGTAPYGEAARYGLGEKELGIQAYLGQLGAQSDWARAQADVARAQADIYGRPIDWFSMLYGGL